MSLRVITVALVLLTLGACGEEEPVPAEGFAAVLCPPDNILTWQSFGDPFLRNWCTGCHSSDLATGSRQDAPTQINLDQQAKVQGLRERIYARAFESQDMPPIGDPSQIEIDHLAQWLACGAP